MSPLQGIPKSVVVLFVKSHRESGYNPYGSFTGLVLVEKKPGHGQRKKAHMISDHAILIKCKADGIGLLFREIADEIGFTIHCNVEIFGKITILEVYPELDFRSISVNRFKNDRFLAVGGFRKPEPDIDSNDLHSASVRV